MKFISLTLNCTPRILTRTHHFIAHANEIGTANDGKRCVSVHGGVYIRYAFIVGWKLINMYSIVLQLGYYFGLKYRHYNIYKIVIQIIQIRKMNGNNFSGNATHLKFL